MKELITIVLVVWRKCPWCTAREKKDQYFSGDIHGGTCKCCGYNVS